VSDTELKFLEFRVQYTKRSFELYLNIPVKKVWCHY